MCNGSVLYVTWSRLNIQQITGDMQNLYITVSNFLENFTFIEQIAWCWTFANISRCNFESKIKQTVQNKVQCKMITSASLQTS